MAGLSAGIQEWRKNLNAQDRETISRQLVRLQVKKLSQPASGRFITCKNAAGKTVLKIYPDRIVFAPGCAENPQQAADGQPLSAFQPTKQAKQSKSAASGSVPQVESPGVCPKCFLQLPVNGRCACDD